MRVLAIGECMAEVSPGGTDGEYRLGFAGDTFNTAWYLARLVPELTVSYLTNVGEDGISQDLLGFMQASGIDTSEVQATPDRTIGLYLISLENGERSFSYWRGQSAARLLADDPDRLTRAMDRADMIFFSGISLAILAPEMRTNLIEAIKRARLGGKSIVFDPNLRPRLWEDAEVMKETIMRGAAVSDLALPSFEDEATWFADETPSDTATRYLEAGSVTAVVKNGSDPVLYAEGDRIGEVPVWPIKEVVDTTAAGDSFNAGLIAGHAAGMDLHNGIALACSLSRKVVQKRGALVDDALPTFLQA